MGLDYSSKTVRLGILEDIKSEENKARKRKSLKEYDCFTDNLKKYIDSAITAQFSAKTKSMMPVVSSINLVKRIVEQQSSIYMEKPDRSFSEDINQESQAVLMKLYDDCQFNGKSLKAEKLFNLQKQTHAYVRLVDGKFIVQPLYLHNIDVVESDLNPEVADAYIISNFDKIDDVDSDQINQKIADKDDYKKSLERYTLWSKEYNFVFDGNGTIVGDDTDLSNELGLIPIIDLSYNKDFTYFVQDGSNLVNFCVDYNVALSDLMFISRLQGFAQGAVSGDKEVLDKMTTVEMGPAHLIKLANSPEGNPTKLEFIQRGSDIAGSIQAIEILLSNFLTSKGIDPKTISGKGDSVKYASGVERLLAMVERFEASRSNYDLFNMYEKQAFEIFKSYINVYSGRKDILDPMYSMTLPEDSQVFINWKKPELVQSEAEKAQMIKSKVDAGLLSKVEAIMIDRNINREQAEEILMQIKEDSAMALGLIDDEMEGTDEATDQSQ